MIYALEVGDVIAVNSYFYIDDATRHGFLIDPGAESERLLAVVREKNFTVEKILLTHGHFDHIGAAKTVSDALDCPICMQANGCRYAENTKWNLSAIFGSPLKLDDVIYLPDDSDIVLAADQNFKLKIIPAPGHTEDGAIYYSAKDKVAFVGDTIFRGSFGRTDLFGGDEATLFATIKQKVLALPDETVLLSGHSEPTTVKDEKTNPWYMS